MIIYAIINDKYAMKNRDLVVVGGGTAGWMTAALLNNKLSEHGFKITVVESPDIPIIGVGEGSTPQLKTFFDTLGIAEAEWMLASQATYKNGIRFNQWTQDKRKNSYFHPFPSITDRETAKAFLINCHRQQNHITSAAHPDNYFLAAKLADTGKSPKVESRYRGLPLNYAYHFDSALLGEFIKKIAKSNGVNHRVATVSAIDLHANGDISGVITESGEKIDAEYFFDCSGFRSLLLQQGLKEPFYSFSGNLFNNAAVAIPSGVDPEFKAQTSATALSSGWAWQIPLRHRTGNGYVFSTEYCSFEQAELELRKHLRLLDSDDEVRKIHMKVGRCRNTWVKNCVAIGLSQGFIEPLEATALHVVQESVESFISAFKAGGFGAQHRQQFNQRINARIDGIRDYIVCHYHASNRTDSRYWLDNTQNTHRSDSLHSLLSVWKNGGDLATEIRNQKIDQFYPAVSWYCLLAGYECFQQAISVKPDQRIERHIDKLAALFVDHSQIVV